MNTNIRQIAQDIINSYSMYSFLLDMDALDEEPTTVSHTPTCDVASFTMLKYVDDHDDKGRVVPLGHIEYEVVVRAKYVPR